MKKAAELNSEAALKMLGGGHFQGMTRSNAANGYVRGVGDESHWPKVINDIKGALSRPDIKLVRANDWVAQSIAIKWAQSDLESSLNWYVHQSEQDLSDPRDTGKIAMVLSSLPEGESYRAVEWIDRQRAHPNWNDEMAMSYGKTVALKSMPLDQGVDRLVGFISDEEERYQFVRRFITPVRTGGEPQIRYSRGRLNQLVTAAGLSDSSEAELRKVIAESKVAQ